MKNREKIMKMALIDMSYFAKDRECTNKDMCVVGRLQEQSTDRMSCKRQLLQLYINVVKPRYKSPIIGNAVDIDLILILSLTLLTYKKHIEGEFDYE